MTSPYIPRLTPATGLAIPAGTALQTTNAGTGLANIISRIPRFGAGFGASPSFWDKLLGGPGLAMAFGIQPAELGDATLEKLRPTPEEAARVLTLEQLQQFNQMHPLAARKLYEDNYTRGVGGSWGEPVVAQLAGKTPPVLVAPAPRAVLPAVQVRQPQSQPKVIKQHPIRSSRGRISTNTTDSVHKPQFVVKPALSVFTDPSGMPHLQYSQRHLMDVSDPDIVRLNELRTQKARAYLNGIGESYNETIKRLSGG